MGLINAFPGAPGGGGNPVGTVISYYGLTAPEGYLVCDGSTYNRVDYPDLAEHLVTNFENLIGNGSTTFAVPDLRGEFLRGTGTNSHTNQGSGANVGVHQDGTEHNDCYATTNFGVAARGTNWADSDYPDNLKADHITQSSYMRYVDGIQYGLTNEHFGTFTSRPTNTSILYCIKY